MDSDFSLKSEVKKNALVIETHGYINNSGGQKISTEFEAHKNSGINRVIMNLENSKVVNSIGISYLIEIIEKLNESGGKLIFTNLDPTIEKTFNIMGLFQFAEKTDTVDAALK